MSMVEVFAKTSEATRLKVGALVVKDDAIISCGVNGTPTGWHSNICEDANGVTLHIVRHAEIAALDKLRRSTNTSTGATMFITHSPCLNCAINIADAGIVKVFYRETYRDKEGENYLLTKGVEVQQLRTLLQFNNIYE